MPEVGSNWWQTPAGSVLLEQENRLLSRHISGVFGYHLLCLGELDFAQGLSDVPISHRLHAGLQVGHLGNHQVLTQVSELAFSHDSVDAVLLPHVLEFHDDPHAVLREIERVIRPDGHVFVYGFNPISCYGLCGLMPGLRKRYPWHGRFYHPLRVRDWLQLLGFDILGTHYAGLRPPLQRSGLEAVLQQIDRLDETILSVLGGVYLIHARKLSVRPTTLKPSWKTHKPRVYGGAVEPSARSSQSVRTNGN